MCKGDTSRTLSKTSEGFYFYLGAVNENYSNLKEKDLQEKDSVV